MEKKPILFEGACLFSLTGSSIGILYTLIATVFFQYVTGKITQFSNITATEYLSPLYFAILMAAFTLSLVGVIKLKRMQRSGLYFYLVAQALILFIPVFWLGSNAFSVTNTIFTLLFSGVYLFHYKYLSKR
ncbi:MAG TPA: hypothetical protein DCL77_09835 [Prolixibacteraceae bacterium]|jgi:hypothetical protein|nr:hypothetical protein [Prolixibacteraceae bacterium]